jgi:hypothetical protein
MIATAALTLSLSSSYHWYDSNWLYSATRFTESGDIVIYWWLGLVLLIPKLISKLIEVLEITTGRKRLV